MKKPSVLVSILLIFTVLITQTTQAQTLNSMDLLKTLSPASQETVSVLGFYVNGDGGGGSFHWDAAATTQTVIGMVIKSTVSPTGRWIRNTDSKTYDIRWFGCRGDGITDNTVDLAGCFTFVANNAGIVSVPAGIYLTGQQTVPSNLKIQGSGMDISVIKLIGGVPSKSALIFIHSQKNITIQNITLDANMQAQNSPYVYDVYGLTDKSPIPPTSYLVSNIYFTHVKFVNSLTTAFKFIGVPNLTNIIAIDCYFDKCGGSEVSLGGVTNGILDSCHFTAWGTLNPKTAPCIALPSLPDTNIQVTHSTVNNTVSQEFFIEGPAAISYNSCFEQNEVWGNYVGGGVGISCNLANSVIGYNHLMQGGGGQRGGVEISANNTLVIGNIIDNGSIALNAQPSGFQGIPFSYGPLGTGNTVCYNIIRDSALHMGGITLSSANWADSTGLTNFTIHDNDIDVSQSTGNCPGINLGAYYYVGNVHNGSIKRNKIRTSYAVHTYPCIRISAGIGGHDLDISDNSFYGYQAMRIDSTNGTNIRIANNNYDSVSVKHVFGVGTPGVEYKIITHQK